MRIRQPSAAVRDASLALLVFILVFEWSAAPRDIFAWVGVVATVGWSSLRRIPLHKSSALMMLLVFAAWCLFTALLSPQPELALRGWIKLATLIAFAWSSAQLAVAKGADPSMRLQRLFTYLTLALTTAYASDVAYWIAAIGDSWQSELRWASPLHFQHPNTYSGLIVASLPLGFHQAKHGTGLNRILLVVQLVCSLALLWLFASRTAQLSLGVLLTISLVWSRSIQRRRLAGLALVVGLALLPILNPRFLEKTMWTLTNRFEVWEATSALVVEKPWLGHGWGDENFATVYQAANPQRTEDFPHAHNYPLQVAFGAGLVGLGLYCLLWFFPIRGLLRVVRDDHDPASPAAKTLLLTIAATAFFSLADIARGPYDLFLWTLWALATTLTYRSDGPVAKPSPQTTPSA